MDDIANPGLDIASQAYRVSIRSIGIGNDLQASLQTSCPIPPACNICRGSPFKGDRWNILSKVQKTNQELLRFIRNGWDML